MRRRLIVVASSAALATAYVMLAGSGGELLIDAVMDIAPYTFTPAVYAIAGLMLTAAVIGVAAAAGEN